MRHQWFPSFRCINSLASHFPDLKSSSLDCTHHKLQFDTKHGYEKKHVKSSSKVTPGGGGVTPRGPRNILAPSALERTQGCNLQDSQSILTSRNIDYAMI